MSGRHRSTRRNHEPATDADEGILYEAQDWQALARGVPVEVTLPGGFSFHGAIDAKTADSSVLWVVSSTGLRKMFGNREGVRLRPLGENL